MRAVAYQCPAHPDPMDDCIYTVNPDALLSMCIHLNDDCEWTREQIAAWLEGQGL